MNRPLICILYYALNCVFAEDLFSIVLTIPMAFLVSFRLFLVRSKFVTAVDVFWFVSYLFFAISPCQVLKDGWFGESSPASGVRFTGLELMCSMSVVLVFYIAFFCGEFFWVKRRGFDPRRFGSVDIAISKYGVCLAFILSIFSFLLYVLFSGGIDSVLMPRVQKVVEDRSLIAPLFLAVLGVSVMVLSVAFVDGKRKFRVFVSFALVPAFLFLLLCANPLNAARFFLIAVWFPVLMTVLKGRIKATNFYVGSLVFLVFLMPVLSVTTRFGVDGLSDAVEEVSVSSLMRLPYIDVFDTLTYSVRYLENNSISLGKNILAIVFFFIPRSVWAGKPIVAGLGIGDELFSLKSATTDNLSFFIGGDFFLDFHFIGVAVGGFLLGVLISIYSSFSRMSVGGQDLYSYVLMGSMAILLRGPVGAVVGLFLCQVVSMVLYGLILKRLSHPAFEK